MNVKTQELSFAQGDVMRYLRPAIAAGFFLVCCAALGQAQGLSIANYELVSQVLVAAPNMEVTYRVTVMNTGAALPPMIGAVTTLDPTAVRVLPGAGTANFPAIPANGEAISTNTVTFFLNR